MQQILDNLNEITEFNENIYNFLENKKDYILSAEELMDELEILTDDTILNNYDTNLQLKTNFDFFNNNFNHFCELIITEPDDKLVNIDTYSTCKATFHVRSSRYCANPVVNLFLRRSPMSSKL